MSRRRGIRIARALRQAETPQEQWLWGQVRDRRMDGLKFRHQHPLHGYVVDFYCAERSLVVEVDGAPHLNPDQAEYDRFKDAALRERGLTVLRLTNTQIDTAPKEALKSIRDAALAAPRARGRSRVDRGPRAQDVAGSPARGAGGCE